MRKLVIIPTYNEIENISRIITAVFDLDEAFDILVIDDGSPDGTADEVRRMQSENNERLYLIERQGKLGLGTAYLAGFGWALDHGYDYVFEMDADFSHAPSDLPRLLEACTAGGADMAVGSRYCNGVSVVNWPIGRILISYFASVFVRKVLGIKVFDSTAGFLCYSRKVLEAIDFSSVRMKGYGFQVEMKYTALKLGFKLAEVPVIFINRREGTSKMSGSIFGEAFWGVIGLRFRKFPAPEHPNL